MPHLARTTQKLYIVVQSWKLIAKKLTYKTNWKKATWKFSPLIEELRGSWFDVKKVTIIRVECYIKQNLYWQDQKSLSKSVTAGMAHSSRNFWRCFRSVDTKFLKCAVPCEQALFARERRHFWLVWTVSLSKVCRKTLCYERTGNGQSFTETCKGNESSNHF